MDITQFFAMLERSQRNIENIQYIDSYSDKLRSKINRRRNKLNNDRVERQFQSLEDTKEASSEEQEIVDFYKELDTERNNIRNRDKIREDQLRKQQEIFRKQQERFRRQQEEKEERQKRKYREYVQRENEKKAEQKKRDAMRQQTTNQSYEEQKTKKVKQKVTVNKELILAVEQAYDVRYTLKLTPGARRVITDRFGSCQHEGLVTNTTIKSILKSSLKYEQYTQIILKISKMKPGISMGEKLGKAILDLNILNLKGNYLNYTDAALACLYMMFITL